MNKHQRIEKALHNISSTSLTDEILSGAQNRGWHMISKRLETTDKQHQLMYFLNPIFAKNLAPALVSIAIVTLLVGIGFTLFQPTDQQPTVVTTIDKKSSTTPNAPDSTTTKPQPITTKSTYTNTDLGFSIELPGQYKKTSATTSKNDFELKDSLALSENKVTFANVAIYTAPNDAKQSIAEWINSHHISGEQKIITLGSFTGVLIKNNPVSYHSIFSHFIAHAASPETEDFYTTNNGRILNISTEEIANSELTSPDFEVSYQTFRRAPRPAFQYGFTTMNYGNKLYLFGGLNNTQLANDAARKVYMYDPIVDIWSEKTSFPEQLITDLSGKDYFRRNGGGVIDGKAYIAFHSGPIIHIYIYDFNRDEWAIMTTTNASFKQSSSPPAVAFHKKLYFIGGTTYEQENDRYTTSKTVDIFNPSSNQWTKGPDLSIPRGSAEITVFKDRIYAFGGETGDFSSAHQSSYDDIVKTTTRTVEYLDSAGDHWVKGPDLPYYFQEQFAGDYLMAAGTDTDLYIFGRPFFGKVGGGQSDAAVKVSIYKLDQKTSEWIPVSASIWSTDMFGIAGFPASIFLLGNNSINGTGKTQLEEFVPSK